MIDCVEQARQDVLNEVKRKRDEKRKILEEQINIIQAEKAKVDSDIQVGGCARQLRVTERRRQSVDDST